MTQRSFGRRRDPKDSVTEAVKVVRQSTAPHSPEYQVPPRRPLPEMPKFSSVDDELREWKRARKPNFHALWRPLLLMATLSFGIASLVLPDSVNDAVDWLLYALTAASFYSWIRSRWQASV
jgi:hypothetical protein